MVRVIFLHRARLYDVHCPREADCTRGRPKTVTNYSRPRACELGVPLTRQHRMLAPPHRDCVTMWALDGAAFFVRRNLHVVVARARVPEFSFRAWKQTLCNSYVTVNFWQHANGVLDPIFDVDHDFDL